MPLAFLLLQSGASDGWTEERHPLLHQVARYGPWLLAATLAFLVVRALVRQHRYRASSVFAESDRAQVREALTEAELHTSGEIVPVVVERSDAHPQATFAWFLIASVCGSVLLEPYLAWRDPHWLILAQLALGFAGLLLALALPDLRRMLVSEARAEEMAEEQAFQEFYRQGVHETRGRTGVLLFVSLFERRVVVLADQGIASQVPPETWDRTKEAILAGIRRGSLRDGLIEGIHAAAEPLTKHFPAERANVNEIEDRLVVRKW